MSDASTLVGGDPAADLSRRRLLAFYAAILIASALFGSYVEYRGAYPQPDTVRESDDSQVCPPTGPVVNCALLQVDSNRYVNLSYNFSLSGAISDLAAGNLVSVGQLNDVLLFLDFDLARRLAPDFPYLLAIIFNAALYIGCIANVRAIARRFDINPDTAALLVVANPEMLFAVTSLNKEIFGIFLVSGMVRASVNRHFVALAVLVAAAMLTRAAFGLFGLAVLARSLLPRLRFWWIAVGASLLVTTILNATAGHLSLTAAPSLLAYSVQEGQRSQAIMTFAGNAMLYPLGPFLGWFLVDGVSIASTILYPNFYAEYLGFNGFSVDLFTMQVSSLLFTVLSVLLAYQLVRTRFQLSSLAEMVFFYLMIFGTFPISQHRYLLSMWPVLALAVLQYHRRNSTLPGAPGQIRLLATG